MSKTDHFIALFQPTATTAVVCGGVYLWRSSGEAFQRYIGIVLMLVGILSVVFYAKKLHELPEAKLINSPETDALRVYMRGGLIAAFIPTAISALMIINTLALPNDGVSVVMYIPFYIGFILLPFIGYPLIVLLLSGSGMVGSSFVPHAWLMLLIACLITRTVMQSMCFLTTNKRIDYCNSRIAGIIGTTFGTINIFFWLGNLSRVKKFAEIEAAGGAAAQ